MTAPYDSFEDGSLFPGYGDDPGEDIDPDLLLETIRDRVTEYLETGELSAAGVEDLARDFDLLDGWISAGSPLPEAWSRPGSLGRRIEDVRVRGRAGQPPL